MDRTVGTASLAVAPHSHGPVHCACGHELAVHPPAAGGSRRQTSPSRPPSAVSPPKRSKPTPSSAAARVAALRTGGTAPLATAASPPAMVVVVLASAADAPPPPAAVAAWSCSKCQARGVVPSSSPPPSSSTKSRSTPAVACARSGSGMRRGCRILARVSMPSTSRGAGRGIRARRIKLGGTGAALRSSLLVARWSAGGGPLKKRPLRE